MSCAVDDEQTLSWDNARGVVRCAQPVRESQNGYGEADPDLGFELRQVIETPLAVIFDDVMRIYLLFTQGIFLTPFISSPSFAQSNN